MKASPVKCYRAPGYPAKLEVQEDPSLLCRNVPPAWRTVPEMIGAVALFLSLSTSGCRAETDKDAPSEVALVAPLFEHGEGRGAIGCIVVTPPVFLSEEEALQVVREELAKSGVEITERGHAIRGVQVPLAEYFQGHDTKTIIRPREDVKVKQTFQADGADPKKRVAVEFVSETDFIARCGNAVKHANGGMSFSSVRDYRIKDLAKFVGKQVQKEAKEKVYFGTFYDPVRDKSGARALESKRLLRLQVQDFVNWLKAQGAI